MSQPKTIYYRARQDQTVNNLPVFFGHLEFQDGKVRGKHYRVNVDTSDHSYLLGYYWLELGVEEFHSKFAANELIEISERDFSILLSRWTRAGSEPVYCWNPEKSYEAENVWGASTG